MAKKVKKEKSQFSIYIKNSLRDQLRKYADEKRRTVTSVLEEIIEKAVA